MQFNFKTLYTVALVACSGASAASSVQPACNADGEYARFAGPTQQRLEIKGKQALLRVVESTGQADRLNDKTKKVLSVDHYTVASESMPSGSIWIDLLDAKGRKVYQGFEYDCHNKTMEHASLGSWVNISAK